MIPFLYPTRPILIIGNHDHIEDDEQDFDDDFPSSPTAILSRIIPIPLTSLGNLVNTDEQIPSSSSTHNDRENFFRLRMNVDGFQPNELNISIRHGRLIVRGKHVVRTQTQSSPPLTTNSIINDNDDTEPDFVSKEFKRTFPIPSNTDVRKAHAQFYPQQQLLVIEIPFQNSNDSTSTRINRIYLRPLDIFLAIIMILSMDRSLRLTYEQFLINEQQSINSASQYRNRRRRENHDIFF